MRIASRKPRKWLSPVTTFAPAERAVARTIESVIPHVPLEEFSLRKVEDLVALLEKSKPKDSKVEVTPMEDSHHAPACRK